jgi:selenocysteine lyase/cysteine desulfurase
LPAALAAGLSLPAAALGVPSRRLLDNLARPHGSPEEGARDEDYWAGVARCFTQDRTIVNLNNGGVSPAPAVVQEAMKRHLDHANSMPPPVGLWREQEPRKEVVRARLAREWGVDAEEVAITRNSSESLQICQLGFDLKPGDELLCCTQDYPRMITTFKQRCRREGLVLKQVKIPIPANDPAEILRIYGQAITEKTRLILLSHIINITGQIMPVRKIVDMARGRNGGIPVIVDGAHALAHFEFQIPDLGCDYYGVSLHKWLAAPHGTGRLYVKRDKIAGLWPLMASEEKQAGDIRKFEEIGTHAAAGFLAISEALDFHRAIGGARKQARLIYLRDRWIGRITAHCESLGLGVGHGRMVVHTPLGPGPDGELLSCGIATFRIDGVDSGKLCDHLWEKHHILATSIKHDEFEGLRITPSVYTTLDQIDRFCEVMEGIVERGLG